MASSERVRGIIDKILASDRLRDSSHFSHDVYGDEPIITTGSQMAGYLPERYQQMRAISRWQSPDGGPAPLGASGSVRGRWLSEAELFYQQGSFMAEWEDDCPYRGSFKSYYPTYNAMSDRQLRGYFTWRTAVRAGDVQPGCLSFAYVYLYELLCGIGVEDALDGFERIRSFWRTYRGFAPELDRYAGVWLQDYVIYHGLDARLLADGGAVAHDRAVAAVIAAEREASASLGEVAGGRRRGKASGVPPLGRELEGRLADAVDELSSYRVLKGRFAREHPADVRHVVCAVWLRLAEHYRRHRKLGLAESLFGTMAELPYTMFASAVFFDPNRHPDADYELDPLNRYRCRGGMWTCTRLRGTGERSGELGRVLRVIDQRMREATGYPHPLKEQTKTPKYLAKIIDDEVAARLAWAEAHKPVEVEIDLSRLAGIRSAAAETREALLIDEEREEGDATGAAGGAAAETESGAGTCGAAGGTEAEAEAKAGTCDAAAVAVPLDATAPRGPRGTGITAVGMEAGAETALQGSPTDTAPSNTRAARGTGGVAAGVETGPGAALQGAAAGPRKSEAPTKASAAPAGTRTEPPLWAGASPGSANVATEAAGACLGPATSPNAIWDATPSPLSPTQEAYARALLAGDAAAAARAVEAAGTSEDLMVDDINEALFDQLGDTAIEFGDDGPRIIDDYREDVEGIVDHG